MGPTLVIKLGTSSLYDEVARRYRLANMAQIVEMVVDLRNKGYRVVLVSSGGIAAGLQVMGLASRPKHASQVQALAAIGQAHLIGLWNELFGRFNAHSAQVLITRADIADRSQYQNAANTLNELLNMNVIPIINENDTVSTYEIRFGDNDTLSAIAAAMIGADYLFLLTDVDCLYTANPRIDSTATPVRVVANVGSVKTDSTTSTGSGVGTGGMTTKLIAANLATSAGITMFICRSFLHRNVFRILEDVENSIDPENSEILYTKFLPHESLKDRAFWLLYGLTVNGSIEIDVGAYKALTRRDRANLLPSGVVGLTGHFHELDCVEIYVKDIQGPVGRCLVNYPALELEKIKGRQSKDIVGILGYSDSEHVAFRDNIAFFSDGPKPE